jgi:hypothetical protein
MVTRLVDADFSGTQEEVAELARRIASWDLYQGALVSDDLTSIQIMITLDASSDETGNPEAVAVLMRLRDMAKEMFAPYANVYTAGQLVVAARPDSSMNPNKITDTLLLNQYETGNAKYKLLLAADEIERCCRFDRLSIVPLHK